MISEWLTAVEQRCALYGCPSAPSLATTQLPPVHIIPHAWILLGSVHGWLPSLWVTMARIPRHIRTALLFTADVT